MDLCKYSTTEHGKYWMVTLEVGTASAYLRDIRVSGSDFQDFRYIVIVAEGFRFHFSDGLATPERKRKRIRSRNRGKMGSVLNCH